MKIFLGTDHGGFEFKEEIKKFLNDEGHEVEDIGALEYDAKDDYPDFIIPAARKVAETPNSKGIIFGGSGQGEAISANRIQGVRAAVFYGTKTAVGAIDISGKKSDDPFEIVKLSRIHNDANILSIGVRFVDSDTAKKAVKLWLETDFTNEERHQNRINKIDELSR